MNEYNNSLLSWANKDQDLGAIDRYVSDHKTSKVRLAVITKPDGSKTIVSCNWGSLSFLQKCKVIFARGVSLSFKDIAEVIAEKKIYNHEFVQILNSYNTIKGKSIFTSGKVIDNITMEKINSLSQNTIGRTLPTSSAGPLTQQGVQKGEEGFFTAISDKLKASAPDYGKTGDMTAFMTVRNKEKERLDLFLKANDCPPTENSFLYLCAGAGSATEQVYPGFIFDALSKGMQVQHLLFELPGWKIEDAQGMISCREAYINAEVPENNREAALEACSDLSKYSVSQFLCGLPQEGWTEINNNLEAYMERYLQKGGCVVIGDHRGAIYSEEPVVQIYNKLLEKYPGQIRFFWAHEGKNAVTQAPLTEDKEEVSPEDWVVYQKLASCLPWKTAEPTKDP